jgi:hypothetical protein
MKPTVSLSQALTDPDLFGSVFASPSFWTWKVVAKLIDGEPLTEPVACCTLRRLAQVSIRR